MNMVLLAATPAYDRTVSSRLKFRACTAVVACVLAVAACASPQPAKPSASSANPSTTSVTAVSPAPSSAGDQASAEAAIRQGYAEKLARCYATRDSVAQIVGIRWNPPGFKENEGGSGHIDAAEEALGGEFTATFDGGRWNTVYHWC
ncbi:MAG: hypothetical protein QOH57_5398 [Mycobacterium sp.]|jgi:hypothetical protein|nr:hypothetical protein [Mycobacterium sp.]